MTAPDLSDFENATREKAPWDRRAQLMTSQFSSIERLAWRKAFSTDIELFGRLVKDILKLDQTQPGRPGPRPALEFGAGVGKLRQYLGEDYSVEPFRQTFSLLADGRSIRNLAHKCDLSKNHVHRLMTGEMEPDAYSMAAIAGAFGKNPSYFLEWRTLWLVNAIASRLTDHPESTIPLYVKFSNGSH